MVRLKMISDDRWRLYTDKIDMTYYISLTWNAHLAIPTLLNYRYLTNINSISSTTKIYGKILLLALDYTVNPAFKNI